MSLNAVQLFLKGLLDGHTLPMTEQGTLTAYVAYPVPVDQIDPLAFIWGAVSDEKRQTAPRAKPGQPSTGGFKKIDYAMDVWLYYAELSDDPNADSLFPTVIDSVTGILRNTVMPASITDTVTGAVSTVLEIGEKIKVDYMPMVALEDQRMVQYEARLIVNVTELIQA